MINEKKRSNDYGIVSNAMNEMLNDMESLEISTKDALFVCLTMSLGYLLKYSPDKYDLFEVISNSMNSALQANEEFDIEEEIELSEWEKELSDVIH